MPYDIVIKRQAKHKLESLPRPERNRITEKIVMLGKRPDNPTLDIKALQGEPYNRLRVGSWRIIFECKDDIRVIAIEKIKTRGDVYK